MSEIVALGERPKQALAGAVAMYKLHKIVDFEPACQARKA